MESYFKERYEEGYTLLVENALQGHKQAAVQFLGLVVAGRIEEAYRKYVDPGGKHHNPFFPEGLPALQKAMSENHVQFPTKQITVKHVLDDGHLVAVHSHLKMNENDLGMTTVHLFRFQGDKIVEMWDCGQAIPADSPNKDGAF